jgi:hypothetical protein
VARDFEDWLDEDECCLECGEIDYAMSKTPGLCVDCWNDLYTHQDRFEEAEQANQWL